jgi:hypothetical protein
MGLLGAGLYGLGLVDIRTLSTFGTLSGLVGSPIKTFIAPVGSQINPHDPLELERLRNFALNGLQQPGESMKIVASPGKNSQAEEGQH